MLLAASMSETLQQVQIIADLWLDRGAGICMVEAPHG